jgi:hypothetical protein
VAAVSGSLDFAQHEHEKTKGLKLVNPKKEAK